MWGDAPLKKTGHLGDPDLLATIKDLYYHNASHNQILRVLRRFKGYPTITDWQLRQIRLRAGLIYRQKARATAESPVYQEALSLIRKDLESSLITQ